MGKNMKRLLLFAIQYPGWHTYGKDRGTVDAIVKLGNDGFIETNAHRQFRLIGNEKLFQLQQDVDDMNSSHRTTFSRCECGHLHDTELVCSHCKPEPRPPVIRPRIAGADNENLEAEDNVDAHGHSRGCTLWGNRVP